MARGKDDVEGEVLDLPQTSENEEKCSGGETRTHNLADDPDEDPEQHQLEQSQLDRHWFIPLLTASDRTCPMLRARVAREVWLF